jgi:hypothetical protein
MGEKIGAIATQYVEDEYLRADAWLLDSSSFESGDGGVELMAKLHESIVLRRVPYT